MKTWKLLSQIHSPLSQQITTLATSFKRKRDLCFSFTRYIIYQLVVSRSHLMKHAYLACGANTAKLLFCFWISRLGIKVNRYFPHLPPSSLLTSLSCRTRITCVQALFIFQCVIIAREYHKFSRVKVDVAIKNFLLHRVLKTNMLFYDKKIKKSK